MFFSHELYNYSDTFDMFVALMSIITCEILINELVSRYTNFVPHFPGRYLTSNVNITVEDASGNPTSVPLGSEFSSSLSA
jgi:hypothetical protein